ncbi:alkaline phosphatase family protein [Natronoglycomyces albus]|uniref:Alkaline phosphatase family protein n=1 Tax=Natronoglycomyces albus TaxID=2811108 RepID=A0A895XEG6_9ACTN|nr:nucleotide pyrophosphatase/phosphodiesterase family protein [Natronoglycomyces albus]QSB04221.1 alkaline phosphatase family protein [Natronoglycomyces albus]
MRDFPLEQVLPRYGDGSLSDLLPSTLALLGVPGHPDRLGLTSGPLAGTRRVAVLLLDGFGYHLLNVAQSASETLREIVNGNLGDMGTLTTNLPSTTPVSLASLGSGSTPGDHGIMGFTVRVPEDHRLLVHILWGSDPDPRQWQPMRTCFEQARDAGVVTTAVSANAFRNSGLTQAVFRGADYVGADSASECALQMRKALVRGNRSLVYGYLPDVDTAGHQFGVGSPEWLEKVSDVCGAIEQLVDGLPSDTALLVTADHGMVNVDHQIHLDDYPHLWDGVELIAGDPRMRYLYTADGSTADVEAAWRETLGEFAEVLTREEAISRGWFGPVGERHAQRVGDVIVACIGTSGILGASGEPEYLTQLVGHHGGLTAAEMVIPLWAYRA